MRVVANVFSILLVFYSAFYISSCKKKDFTVDYYREVEDIISDSSNVDVVLSELVNNGFTVEANDQIEKTDWEYFFKRYKSSSILDYKTIEVKPLLENLDSIFMNNTIVMFNENHFLSYQREMFSKIADKARSYGYDQVAIEALADNSNSSIMDESGVFLEAGYYTKDPYFSNTLLDLQSLDYDLISYEPSIQPDLTDLKTRDSLMAENIIRRFNTSGRLLIFCGWGHAGNFPHTLRYYLNEKLPNKKIASINQIILFPESRTTIYDSISTKIDGTFDKPSLVLKDNKPITFNEWYEYLVISPEKHKYHLGRKIPSSLITELASLLPESPCDRLFIYNKNTLKSNQKYVPLAIIQDANEIKRSLGSIPSFIDEISAYKYCKGELIFLENIAL